MSYDIIVIGGGPAGYVSAIKASQMGAKVAIVEKYKEYGGTCLNRGCIPTKTYVKNAEIIETVKSAKKRGIVLESEDFSLDMKKIVNYKNRVVRRLTSGIRGLLKSYDVDMFNTIGKITSDKKVKLEDGTILEGKSIIFAGGSVVSNIKIPGTDHPKVVTSDEILDIEEVPKRLAIVGGGVIGTELATIFNAYGSEVTIIQSSSTILGTMDKDVIKEITDAFRKKKIKIETDSKLSEIEDMGDSLRLHIKDKDPIEADLVLMAIGRTPDLEGMGEIELEKDRGAVVVNDRMETSVEGIYAPGDINARLMLAHAASKMGEVAVINALGGEAIYNKDNTPSCVYTLPEVSMVGLTEDEAREKYSNISVGSFPFGANGRALASGETEGFVKVIANLDDKKIVGVHIIGVNGAELINEAAALMENGVSVEEVAETVHAHPTYSEAFMEACADALSKSIHLPKK